MLSTLWTCQHGSFIEPAPPIDANKRVFPPGSSLAWWPHVWGSEASIRIFALAAPKTSIKESVGSTACAPKTSRFAQCLHAAFLPALAKILRVQVNVQLQSFGQSWCHFCVHHVCQLWQKFTCGHLQLLHYQGLGHVCVRQFCYIWQKSAGSSSKLSCGHLGLLHYEGLRHVC